MQTPTFPLGSWSEGDFAGSARSERRGSGSPPCEVVTSSTREVQSGTTRAVLLELPGRDLMPAHYLTGACATTTTKRCTQIRDNGKLALTAKR